jgi:hypothetical protein
MILQQYAETIATTDKDDWTFIKCRGRCGPSFLDRIGVSTDRNDKFIGMEVQDHSMRASLKNDLSIAIAWGFPRSDEFMEEWANQFPDPHATSGLVDFFYNGNLVYRDVYVSIDGGKCNLPLPEIWQKEDGTIIRLTVPKDQYSFFRMLDRMEKISDFDHYFRQAKFEIVDRSWMDDF